MSFEIVSELQDICQIASGNSIREHKRLQKIYRRGRWKKLKGKAEILSPAIKKAVQLAS